jgi:cation/acetate symporter
VIAVAATVLVSFVYLVVQVYGVGLVTSHLTGFGFEIGVFVGLGGVLVCSFLGGMRAVTWTQVAQYIVLIMAYTGAGDLAATTRPAARGCRCSATPAAEGGAERETVADRPGRTRGAPPAAERADDAERKLRDVPAAMASDTELQGRQIERMRRARAAGADPASRAERWSACRAPSPGARRYQRQRDQAQAQAQPLAGLPPQAGQVGARWHQRASMRAATSWHWCCA